VTIEPLRAHRKSDQLKPVATSLLTKLGGLSQREVANLLGVTTGAAISAQLKRLKEALGQANPKTWPNWNQTRLQI
jgi:hypothetical protein